MAATRLLVIADSKMLPALANGLRDGATFDVQAVPLSDPAGAQAAAQTADAVAVFYGGPGAPLPAALQALSPRVRERGGRVVAVLQREQLKHRDDCFRAGASDLLFMPMPKEQFVVRLQGALELSFAADAGAPAPVSVATRKAASRIDKARVCASGVEADAELPVKPGETVRLQWGKFQAWGLVVRGGPSAQIRFAGLSPEEEAQIRDWVKGDAQEASPPAAAVAAAPTPPAGSPPVAARAAPAAGPPPGFADRRPVRPQTRAPVRAAPAPAPAAAEPSAAPAPLATALFDEGAVAPAVAAGAPPPLPSWPVPAAAEACRATTLQVLGGDAIAADAAPSLTASARKVAGIPGSAERAAIESAGPDSPLAAALYARVALDLATGEGARLLASGSGAAVDAAAVAALTAQGDAAAARLQKEANAAVAAGDVERLQLITAASAALSRDLLAFRETSDRLQGLAAAPRLGSAALDPDVVLAGQAPRPRPQATEPAPVRAELRDFEGLEEKSGPGRAIALVLLLAALAGALGYALYFSVPRHRQLSAQAAGRGVQRIDVSGESAQVTIDPAWLDSSASGLPPLVAVLREGGVKKAVLILANGTPAGVLDVASGKAIGLPARQEPAEPPK